MVDYWPPYVSGVWSCAGAEAGIFPTEGVMKSGAVGKDTCDKSGKIREKFKPKPGKIVIFVKKLTLWDRVKCAWNGGGC